MAGAVGTVIVWFVMFSVMVYSCQNGLPALKNGTFAPVFDVSAPSC